MTGRKQTRAITNVAVYVLCVLASMYLAGFAAAELSNLTYHALWLSRHFDPPDPMNFYAGHWLLFNLISGGAAGLTVYAVWGHKIALFVWVPSAMRLCQKILTHQHSVLESNWSGVRYFLSTGCSDLSAKFFYISPRCADQFHYSLPFYAGLGFSLGALLSMFCGKAIRQCGAPLLNSLSPSYGLGNADDAEGEDCDSPKKERSSNE